jgi:hypothetical protein
VALTATLELSSEQLTDPALWRLRVEVRNDGSRPVRISTATMLGGVSFEVIDAEGARVPRGPPPVPPPDLAAEIMTIEPGAALSLDFRGDELFPEAPASGRYRLRFAAQAPAVEDAWSGPIVSPWVPFVVGGE